MLCKACGHRPRFSEQSIYCEDEEPTLELLCEHLTADRYRALPAPSTSDALRLCHFMQPDLLLLVARCGSAQY